ncbi:MerR family transcriptional regulator [Cryptosporangium arvum]|uniref:Putative transcriptional regulator n=1 Tax=Cryptosporangium arvum DSM 44712 TaxID=927661 RepID=A0A010Z497_9ACTN|nr:MerR family transcriptional regulator [Cryptosporangium arvum]EXG82208.1 putative transcriptional regulator [Cryptosporangium arvum DSM 44712]
MAWSTRELAELAGTTVNTIRHYHRLGLLEEPERRYNGYKQYGVEHLICLLRIRRLVELGVPLAQIGEVRTNGAIAPDVLRQVDAELAAEAERLRRARSDIATILSTGASADTPSGFESVASRLSEADKSLIHVHTRLYDEDAMKDLQRMAEADEDPTNGEFDALSPEADDATRQRLAERIAPVLVRHLADYPWLSDATGRTSMDERATRETFIDAVANLYNPAQLDVMGRAGVLAQEQLRAARETPPDDVTAAG